MTFCPFAHCFPSRREGNYTCSQLLFTFCDLFDMHTRQRISRHARDTYDMSPRQAVPQGESSASAKHYLPSASTVTDIHNNGSKVRSKVAHELLFGSSNECSVAPRGQEASPQVAPPSLEAPSPSSVAPPLIVGPVPRCIMGAKPPPVVGLRKTHYTVGLIVSDMRYDELPFATKGTRTQRIVYRDSTSGHEFCWV